MAMDAPPRSGLAPSYVVGALTAALPPSPPPGRPACLAWAPAFSKVAKVGEKEDARREEEITPERRKMSVGVLERRKTSAGE